MLTMVPGARWQPLALILVLAFWTAPGALATTPPARAAAELAKSGAELFRTDRYQEALETFRRAYELYPDSYLLQNMARCHEELGQLEDAVAYFDKFLATDPKGPSRLDALARRAKLVQALQARPIVHCVDVPPGVEILSAGARIPARFRLLTGRATLEFWRYGVRLGTVAVRVETGEVRRINVRALLGARSSWRREVAGPARSGRASPDVPEMTVEVVPHRAGWVVGGVGLGLTAAAVGLTLAGNAAHERADGATNQAERDGFVEERDAYDTAAWALYGVGGAMVVTSVVLLLTVDEELPVPWVGTDGHDLTLGWRYRF